MGFEVRIYVGERCGMGESGADYFMTAGMVDLCKPGYESAIYKLCTTETDAPPVYGYFMDGDKRETDDCYGTTLRAIPIQSVIDALEKDAADDDYHRFAVALDVLKSFRDKFKSKRLNAMLYGY